MMYSSAAKLTRSSAGILLGGKPGHASPLDLGGKLGHFLTSRNPAALAARQGGYALALSL
jgi:hypothetical protein